jgi:hypothetical protein
MLDEIWMKSRLKYQIRLQNILVKLYGKIFIGEIAYFRR